MLNNLVLMGRLTKDPELRKTADDKSIANFTLAFDNPNLNKDGERDSSFLDARCFGSCAESVAKHLRKGDKVAVTGSLTSRSYLAKDGSKRVVFEIQADSVEFLTPKPVENKSDEVQQAEQVEAEIVEEPEAKFDPYTGKPLNKSKKK